MFLERVVENNIPEWHPQHWLEACIKSRALGMSTQQEHDEEHERQLKYWGCDPTHLSKLNTREGAYDRLYHVMLHLRFWKETSDNPLRLAAVKKFEDQTGFDLNNLTIPDASAAGSSVY